MVAAAFAFAAHRLSGHFTDAGGVARGLAAHRRAHAPGSSSRSCCSNASIIGAGAVTLATSYAFGDVFGIHHSLHRSWREAKLFYATFAAIVVVPPPGSCSFPGRRSA